MKWVVVEEGKAASPHSRLPQWEVANQLKDSGELVFKWPKDPQNKVPTVCVYKVVVQSP